MTNTSKREAPAVVLETDTSKVGEHLSTTEVRSGKDPSFSE